MVDAMMVCLQEDLHIGFLILQTTLVSSLPDECGRIEAVRIFLLLTTAKPQGEIAITS